MILYFCPHQIYKNKKHKMITELTVEEMASIEGGEYIIIYRLGPNGEIIMERKNI
ncbi:bacteriocin-type signal sequence-containing protein [Bacteroides luti]|jgi:hypothetical protein|uniref:Bacteriocin-type signal sequence-containing protein n=1 Tax=Bacteroides luti TaxID=1297750 RepID=A0A1M5H0X7_9BACE|nr:bacteriocin-type signal sequence-containing protein [Bacteroides luti]